MKVEQGSLRSVLLSQLLRQLRLRLLHSLPWPEGPLSHHRFQRQELLLPAQAVFLQGQPHFHPAF
jgi:hypothetical protein